MVVRFSLQLFSQFTSESNGVTSIEYALLVGLLSMMLVPIMSVTLKALFLPTAAILQAI